MGGEVKADGGGGKQRHFLGNAGLNLVVGAAAEAVDAQHHPVDTAVVRLREPAGDFQAALREEKGLFHFHHPVKSDLRLSGGSFR